VATMRERWWTVDGRKRLAWQVDFKDAAGKRRCRQFPTHDEADRFLKGVGLRATYPSIAPSTDPIIVHVTAECPPSSSPHDVDNLLKPVLDALAGHAYVNDTQVVEYLIRNTPGPTRTLKVEVWAIAAFHHLPH
jgi:Endodeoxyribonuclease RusA